jgi:hypothetical protein
MPKTVLISYPLSREVEKNIAEVIRICKLAHSHEIIPLFPHLLMKRYVTDDPPGEQLAEACIWEYFKRGMVDELWLYGNHISPPMWREIHFAQHCKVEVVPKSPQTAKALRKGPPK